jgi:IS66 Orf2 like protein
VIGPTGAVRVMVATKPVDFRKGAEGLAALVRETMTADPFSGVNLGLAIQWKMVGIFGHQNLGDGGLGRHAALNQACWRRGLHDTVLATSAGIFRPDGDEHPELRWHNVQPLALVLTLTRPFFTQRLR